MFRKMFASWLESLHKHSAIASYVRLKPILVRRFGEKEHYTPEEVARDAKEAKLSIKYLRHGFAIYCTEVACSANPCYGVSSDNYWTLRHEVAQHHFGGNAAFTPQDVTIHAHTYAHAGFHHGGGGHFHGGGHSGGGHGGRH